jgi:hypothetical protein
MLQQLSENPLLLACICPTCKKRRYAIQTWQGLTSPPEVLVIDIKTYIHRVNQTNLTDCYEFLYSNILLDETIKIPVYHRSYLTCYVLRAFIVIEGKCHEHAVAFVRAENQKWWKCSDEDITSVVEDIHHFTSKTYNQIALAFYIKSVEC